MSYTTPCAVCGKPITDPLYEPNSGELPRPHHAESDPCVPPEKLYVADVRARTVILSRTKPVRRQLRLRETMTVRDVFNRLRRVLEREGLYQECESFGIDVGLRYAKPARDSEPFFKLLPGWRWIAGYAVTGSNEGHNIHIEFVGPGEQRHSLDDPRSMIRERLGVFTGKTFSGWAHAAKVAARVAELLGA